MTRRGSYERAEFERELIVKIEYPVIAVMAQEHVFKKGKCQKYGYDGTCHYVSVSNTKEWPTEEMSDRDPSQYLKQMFKLHRKGAFWSDVYSAVYRCRECDRVKVVFIENEEKMVA